MENTGKGVVSKRHAYLIMAHDQFDFLKLLLEDLDHADNNIFLHVDKKAADYSEDDMKRWVRRADIHFLPRQVVNWGGFSQIQCIVKLLKYATDTGHYLYYHFMVGSEFPLKSQDEIHKFFRDHNGYEFIGYDPYDIKFEERVRYYHAFNEFGRSRRISGRLKNKYRRLLLLIQKQFHYQINCNTNITLKKGNANWSITDKLARYIVSNSKQICTVYAHSFCGDEVFIHTLVYNSDFYSKVFDTEDEYHSCMRLSQWGQPDNIFHIEDLPELLQSDRLFARKFKGPEGIQMVQIIKNNRIGKKDTDVYNEEKNVSNR